LKEIAASIEHGERPQLLLLKTWNQRRQIWEVQIITVSPSHRIENVSYATKDPATWTSTGQIVLSLEAAMRMGRELVRVASAATTMVKLHQQLLDLGVNPNQVIREEEAKKIKGMRIAYKFGAKPRPRTYEFTWREKIEILQEKLEELKEQRTSK